MGRTRRLLLTLLAGALLAGPARAIDLERPPLPDFAPAPAERGSILPAFVPPRQGGVPGLFGEELLVQEVRVVGNTVLPPEALHRVASPYLGRPLDYEDVRTLRDALTQLYVDAGYATSGFVVPAQDAGGGVLELWAVEGRLAEVRMQTDGRFRAAYVESRLAREGPLDVNALEERLQTLRRDPRILAIHARLVPSEVRGESLLEVRLQEARPWVLRFGGDNYGSPLVGEWRGRVRAAHENLLGLGDRVELEYAGGRGLQELRWGWEMPVTRYDTTLRFTGREVWSEVVEPPFDAFDIETRIEEFALGVEQPVFRSPSTKASLFVAGEYRRSKAFLLGSGFAFTPGLSEDGEAKIAVLRFGQGLELRSERHALALRSTLSVGTDWLGATENPAGVPDGQFVAWLAQAQWAWRLPVLESRLLVRGDLQLTDSPLLGLERLAIGGHDTVRGYRENQQVRDNGVIGSVELRVPVPPVSEWLELELAPFVDVGHSWNEGPTFGRSTLLGIGAGVLGRLGERFRWELYWGSRILSVPEAFDKGAQDHGLHLGVSADL